MDKFKIYYHPNLGLHELRIKSKGGRWDSSIWKPEIEKLIEDAKELVKEGRLKEVIPIIVITEGRARLVWKGLIITKG